MKKEHTFSLESGRLTRLRSTRHSPNFTSFLTNPDQGTASRCVRVCVSLSLSAFCQSLTVCVCVCLSSLSLWFFLLCVCVYPSLSPSLSLWFFDCVCVCVYPSLSLSLSLPLSQLSKTEDELSQTEQSLGQREHARLDPGQEVFLSPPLAAQETRPRVDNRRPG